MTNTIKPKSRSLDASPPTTDALSDGEIAVNAFSRKIFQRVGTQIITIANYFSGTWADLSGKPTTLAGFGITDAQARNDTLTALAGLSTAANQGVYTTGVDTFAAYDLSAGGRALANVAGTANTFPYFSDADVVSLQGITAQGRALLDDADPSAQRTTLGLGTAAISAATDFAMAAHSHSHADLTGTAPIWNQDTTGNAATATRLAAARTINGVAFDGTADITLVAVADWAGIAGKPTTLSGYGITDGVIATRTIIAGNGLSGGGDLTTHRTVALGTPGTLSGRTTNAVTATSHTHAVQMLAHPAAAADLADTYPINPTVGTAGTGFPATSGTVLTAQAAVSTCVFQLFSPSKGGTNVPELYLRAHHTTDGGGGWTEFRRVWTDGSDGAGSGLDADALDGQQGSHYLAWGNFTGTPTTIAGYGISDAAKTGTLGTGDFNTLVTSGLYRFDNGNANGPGFPWAQVIVSRGPGDTCAQLAIDYAGAHLKWRGASALGGTPVWSAWRSVWHDGNFNPTSKVDTAVLATAGTANSVAQRDASGDLSSRLFRSSFADNASISGAMAYRVNSTTDSAIRFCADKALIRSFLGLGSAALNASADFAPVAHDNLRTSLNTAAPLHADWNAATNNGWWMASNAANAPNGDAGWFIGIVSHHNANWITQEVWKFTDGTGDTMRYRRQKNNGTWSAWTSNQVFGQVSISAGGAFIGNGSGTQHAGSFYQNGTHHQMAANGAAWIRMPRTFVQSGDPGAQASDGDLWIW